MPALLINNAYDIIQHVMFWPTYMTTGRLEKQRMSLNTDNEIQKVKLDNPRKNANRVQKLEEKLQENTEKNPPQTANMIPACLSL